MRRPREARGRPPPPPPCAATATVVASSPEGLSGPAVCVCVGGGRGRKGDVSRRPSLHPHPPSGHPASRLSLLLTNGPRSRSSSVLFAGCPHGPRLPTARASALETPGPGCQNALATQNRRNSTRYRSGSVGRSRLASTRKVPEKAQAEQRARGGTEGNVPGKRRGQRLARHGGSQRSRGRKEPRGTGQGRRPGDRAPT